MQSSVNAVTSSEILTGRVKWFNNKVGYGFITVTDGSRTGTDVFAHHSAVTVGSQQYRYLVQGEYVEFQLSPTQTGKHEFQATNISGIKSGQLMCETRNVVRNVKNSYNSSKTDETNLDKSQETETEKETLGKQKSRQIKANTANQSEQVRLRGEGPRESDKKGWTIVGNNINQEKQVETKKVRKPRQSSQSK